MRADFVFTLLTLVLGSQQAGMSGSPSFGDVTSPMHTPRAELVKYLAAAQMTGYKNPKDAALYDNLSGSGIPGLSPCEIEVGVNQTGRYLREISRAFPNDVVRSEGPNRNLRCQCTTAQWMICTIIIVPGSEEHRAIQDKLHRSNHERMIPFYEVPSILNPRKAPLLFHKKCAMGLPIVFAEIEVIDRDACASMDVCIGEDGSSHCPLTRKVFQNGDSVFVLRSDEEKVSRGEKAPCMHLTGLRDKALSDTAIRNGGFKDPLSRSSKLVNLRDDYSQFLIFNDEDLAVYCASGNIDEQEARIFRGAKVQIYGLEDVGSDINGFSGFVKDYDMEMGRYEIRVQIGDQPALDIFGLQRSNIHVIEGPSASGHGALDKAPQPVMEQAEYQDVSKFDPEVSSPHESYTYKHIPFAFFICLTFLLAYKFVSFQYQTKTELNLEFIQNQT